MLTLREIAEKVFDRLEFIEEPGEGWEAAAPSWAGKGSSRGLQEWGSRTFKKSRTGHKRWQSGGLCQMVIQEAFAKFVEYVCLPPVVTGWLHADPDPDTDPTTNHTQVNARKVKKLSRR